MATSDLTHSQMHEIVDRGEAFLHDGQVIGAKHLIPSPEALAVTTQDKNAVRSALDAEIEALQRRRAAIDTEGTAAEQEADDTTKDVELDENGLPKKYADLHQLALAKGFQPAGRGYPSRKALGDFLQSRKEAEGNTTAE